VYRKPADPSVDLLNHVRKVCVCFQEMRLIRIPASQAPKINLLETDNIITADKFGDIAERS
jgi:hypothetical protein